MNKTDVITELYNDEIIPKLALKHKSMLGDYFDDFIQQMYLILCEMDEEKLIELYEKNELNYYLYYVIKSNIFNEKSGFWRIYKCRLKIDGSIDDENYKYNKDLI